jgi:hypothetical protein
VSCICFFDDKLSLIQPLSSRLEKANVRFISLTPESFQVVASNSSKPYTHNLSTTRKLETERRYALELWENTLKQVIDMEVDLGLERRCDPSSPEYLETLGYLSTRTYQRALEELQRLVVQRLFELHKMNISATGEQVHPYAPRISDSSPQLTTCERTSQKHYRAVVKLSAMR